MTDVPDEVAQAQRDPTKRFGRFVLLAELGRGGMGAVYRAWDPNQEDVVALKLLLDSSAPAAVERFTREARAASELDHPGIVQVFEVGISGRTPFLVMELIEGKPLAQLLRDAAPDEETAARIVRDVARAIGHAHEAGIVHRDLKPANVLVDADGGAHVVDFGIVRFVTAQSLTTTGETLGTPGYMAPEQAAGERAKQGPKTDVYALGAMLYRILTGKTPFQGLAFSQVLFSKPVPPRVINPDANELLSELALRALEKEPENRPTAPQFAAEIDRYLARHEKKKATPRAPSRWPLFLVIGAFALAAVLVGGAVLAARLQTPSPSPSPPPRPPVAAPSPPPGKPPVKPSAPARPLRCEALFTIGSRGELEAASSQPSVGEERGCALALDAAEHRLFVALTNEHRIFVYQLDERNALDAGDPLFVIGQPDLAATEALPVEKGFDRVRALAYDSARHLLHVADTSRQRVLVYQVGARSAGAPIYVIGKLDPRTGRANMKDPYAWFGPQGVREPSGLALADDVLYVSGTKHDRVNAFPAPAIDRGIETGMAVGPSALLGRMELNGKELPPLPTSPKSLNRPWGLAAGLGWLFVSDTGANRVVAYPLPVQGGGADAALVIGQDDLSSEREKSAAVGAGSLREPRDLALDTRRQRLYVADYGHRRVLAFDVKDLEKPPVAARFVLGQPDMQSAESPAATDELGIPTALAVDAESGRLFVGDERTGAITTFVPPPG